jgi:hypothetical protein
MLQGSPAVDRRPIVDRTGLQCLFSFRLEYAAPPIDPASLPPGVVLPDRGPATAASIFTALDE